MFFFAFSLSNCHQCRHFVIVAFLRPWLLAFSRTLAMACLLFSNNKPDIYFIQGVARRRYNYCDRSRLSTLVLIESKPRNKFPLVIYCDLSSTLHRLVTTLACNIRQSNKWYLMTIAEIIKTLTDCPSLQKGLDKVYDWSVAHQLPISVRKCSCIVLGNVDTSNTVYNIGKQPIGHVSEVRDLGIIENLWKSLFTKQTW